MARLGARRRVREARSPSPGGARPARFLADVVLALAPLLGGSASAAAQSETPIVVQMPPAELEWLGARTETVHRLTRTGFQDLVIGGHTLALGRDEMLITADSTQAPRLGAGRFHVLLPIKGLLRDGSGASHRLQVGVDPGEGLAYDPRTDALAGVIGLGIEDRGHPDANERLPSPLALQLLGADRFVPSTVRIDHTGAPLVFVSVVTRVATDSVRVRAHLQGGAPTAFNVGIRRTPLGLRPTAGRIYGLGLQVDELLVPFPEDFGGDSMEVTVTSDRVSPSPSTLVLRRGRGPGRVSIRSRGLGWASLTVSGPYYTSPGRTRVRFTWPVTFLLAAVFGGAAGAGVRQMGGRRRRSRRGARRLWSEVWGGVLVGLVVAVGGAVGLRFIQTPISGLSVEGAVFVTATLGGMLGKPAVLRLVPHFADRLLRWEA